MASTQVPDFSVAVGSAADPANPSAALAAEHVVGSDLPWVSAVARDAVESADKLDARAKERALRLINILTAYAVYDKETGYC